MISVFWFRRDLRLADNAGLYHALCTGRPVLPVFIFDTEILDDLQHKADKRIAFIRDTLLGIQKELKELSSTLHVLHGKPLDCFRELTELYTIEAVYTNHDYEPYATERDNNIAAFLKSKGIAFRSYKDQVIFEKKDVLKDNGEPYTVYTPYSKKWKATLSNRHLEPYPSEKHLASFLKQKTRRIPSLETLGFENISYNVVAPVLNKHLLEDYTAQRNYPALDSTTHLSTHLRFGTISIRKLVREAKDESEDFINELIWREFFQMILWHFPHVVHTSFKKEYDAIAWRNNEEEFKLWCAGQTGFPLVDAGMRELNKTGYMHNRVRMVVAGFLVKDLLIDWRWGEAYFAEKLLDYDLASNNGNWQWAAGCGCDAAPYFRVFNPHLQAEKFDRELKYIKKWVPEYDTLQYTQPIVDHSAAKERCMNVYKTALRKE